jgi:hypothetical protein
MHQFLPFYAPKESSTGNNKRKNGNKIILFMKIMPSG